MKRGLCLLFCVIAVVVSVLCPTLLLAAGELPALTAEPVVDFSTVFTSLSTLVTTIVVGALGIGLAIWVTRYLFHLVKSMSRG